MKICFLYVHKIICGIILIKKGNDYVTKHIIDDEYLYSQWNFEKNTEFDPSTLLFGSNKKVWWICEKGHEWQTVISSRALNNAGCPYCTNRKVLSGYNDLVTTNPKLAKEWNYHRNINIKPTEVSSNSHEHVWWRCSTCGHEWNAEIKSRNFGVGCPICGKKKLSQTQINNSIKKVGSLQETNPKLAKEWNYEKNYGLTPDKISAGSNKKIWWKCEKGHEWEAVLSSRNSGVGCPYCANKKILKGYNDLLTKNPSLAKEWNYEKNKNLNVSEVSPNSHKHVWWKCSTCEYEWKAEIKSRNSGVGCPICSKSKQTKTLRTRLIENNGSLESLFPKLSEEWNYEKNDSLLPSMFTPGSNKKVWWKCDKGHEWQAVISSRALNSVGCPICANETQTSFAEQTLYYYLRKQFDKVINRYTIENQEIDIFIPQYNIGIEYDGARFHNKKESIKREQNKYRFLKEKGITLIRIREFFDAKYNVDSADYYLGYSNDLKNKNLNKIVKDLFTLLSEITNIKINNDVNIDRDRSDIYDLYILSEKEKSLATLKPLVAKYWNYEKNGGLTPDKVAAGSSKKVWWKCDKGHEWQAIISSRTNDSDCPYCLNQKLLIGFNDLQTSYPYLAKEWDEKRNKIKANETLAGGSKKAYWICSECGNRWQAIVSSRIRGNGCSKCKNNKISKALQESGLKKYGSLSDNYPKLLQEWDYDKNESIDPKRITSSARYKVWWICSDCGNKWQAWIGDRTQGKGCPECGKKEMISKRINNQIKNNGSLKTNNKELSKEWNYEKNKDLKPEKVTSNSNKKVWWKCSVCGYEWEAQISSRNKGAGCPKCTNHLKKKILQFDKDNNFIKEYDSISSASKSTGIHTTSISNVCKGNAKTAGGYIWSYVEDNNID